jgi:hypothetical protein
MKDQEAIHNKVVVKPMSLYLHYWLFPRLRFLLYILPSQPTHLYVVSNRGVTSPHAYARGRKFLLLERLIQWLFVFIKASSKLITLNDSQSKITYYYGAVHLLALHIPLDWNVYILWPSFSSFSLPKVLYIIICQVLWNNFCYLFPTLRNYFSVRPWT